MALQYLFAPKVKQPPVDRGRFDDIRIQGSDYGAFIPRWWGRVRLAGQVVFSNGIQHYVIETPSSGGKGVPQAPATRTHVYKTSVAILLGGSPTTVFRKMWADADQLLGNDTDLAVGDFEAEDASLGGGASVFLEAGASNGEAVQGLGSGGTAAFDISSVIAPPFPRDDPDEVATPYTLITFRYRSISARTAHVYTDLTLNQVLFPGTGADWTLYSLNVSGHTDTVTFGNPSADAPDLDMISIEKYWFYEPDPGPFPPPLPFGITGIVDPSVAYPPDINDPTAFYNKKPAADPGTGIVQMNTPIPGEQIRFYKGTTTQTADAAIIAWLNQRYGPGQGVLRASAMRPLTYVMFENYTLKNGRLPNFTVELENNDNEVNDVLSNLLADVGIASGDYDLAQTAGLDQVGFLEHQKTSRRQLVELLSRYHQFRIGEIDGKIRTIADTATSQTFIPAENLRAHYDTEELPQSDYRIEIKEESLLPRRINVSVMNPALEFHNEPGTAEFFTVAGTETKEYTFPIVDPLQQARTVAEKLILKEYAEDKAIEWTAMPSEAKWAIGDVVYLPIKGVQRAVRIESRSMGLPIGVVKFQCITVQKFAPINLQDQTTARAPVAPAQLAFQQPPRNTVIFPIQSAAIRDKDIGRFGVYLAISGRGRGFWPNAGLYRELADGEYVVQQVIETATPLGLCEDVLGTHGDISTEDTTNTLDIWFFDNIELESVLAADLDKIPQLNLIRIGDEWVQFRTATPQTLEENSPYRSKWRISNLRRGRFFTGAAVATHAADEYAALATSSMVFFDLTPSDLGTTINLKAVTGGQDLENAPVASFTFIGATAAQQSTDGDIVLANLDSGRLFTDASFAAQRNFVLPAGASGLVFRFAVVGSFGLSVTADGSETISIGGDETIAGGSIDSAAAGAFIVLEWISDTWYATSQQGLWNVEHV